MDLVPSYVCCRKGIAQLARFYCQYAPLGSFLTGHEPLLRAFQFIEEAEVSFSREPDKRVESGILYCVHGSRSAL
jgi:hypothetical protein